MATASDVNDTLSSTIHYYNEAGAGLFLQLIISAIGLVANVAVVIAAHVKDPLGYFRTPSSWFVFNIGVIDTLATACYVFTNSLYLVHIHSAHKANQRMLAVIIRMSRMVNVLTYPAYFALSADRFVCVAFPLWYRTRQTARRCCLAICALWLMHWTFQLTITWSFSFFELPPITVPSFLYLVSFFLLAQLAALATFVSLRRQRRRALATLQDGNQARATIARIKNEKRFVATMAITSLTAGVTQLPVVLSFVYFGRMRQIHPSVAAVINATSLALIGFNFAVNPFFYLWRLSKYMKTFKALYCCTK